MSQSPAICALLVIDMISDFQFEDGDKLYANTARVVANMAWLQMRFRQQGLPVIYVNDNYGQWDAVFPDLVEWACRDGSLGRRIVEDMQPMPGDSFILKPRHSGFYQTPLPSLLESLKVCKLVIVGVAGDACVLNTAMDAHMRGFDLWVPRDAVASITTQRNDRALAHLQEAMQVRIDSVHSANRHGDICAWNDAEAEAP